MLHDGNNRYDSLFDQIQRWYSDNLISYLRFLLDTNIKLSKISLSDEDKIMEEKK